MYLGYSISVVMPCLNEEQAIKKVLSTMPSNIDEIIVVDNNSTDNTARVARKLGATVVLEKKRGYGAALKAGIYKAKSQLILILDGDGTYLPESAGELITHLHKNNLDFVSGNRFNKQYPRTIHPLNFLGNILLTQCTRVLYFRNIADSQSGMMLFRKSILPNLVLTRDGMSFSEEIKLEAILHKHVAFGEHPIAYRGNQRIGKKKLRMWRDGFETLSFLVSKRLATLFQSS
jgi:dolichol-phosphate hexosyltransferase